MMVVANTFAIAYPQYSQIPTYQAVNQPGFYSNQFYGQPVMPGMMRMSGGQGVQGVPVLQGMQGMQGMPGTQGTIGNQGMQEKGIQGSQAKITIQEKQTNINPLVQIEMENKNAKFEPNSSTPQKVDQK